MRESIAYRILSEVKQAGGSLECVGQGRLRVAASRPLPAELVEKVKANKTKILLSLCAASVLVDQESYDERVAIIQANGVPREWAEGFAFLDGLSLPDDFTVERWHQVINDGGIFLDRWGKRAFELGWTARDVFGVDPNAPNARYDGMGLVVVLMGYPVDELTELKATILHENGVTLTFDRRTMSCDSVPVWMALGHKGQA